MDTIIMLAKKIPLVIPLMVAACALTDVSTTPTAFPPITLNPPPSLNLTGTCDNTKNLEDWLQVTTILVSDFQTKMNEAAGKSRGDAYQPTLDLAALRDSAYLAATPDCATDIELTLSDAMTQAVNALQSFVNGETTDFTSTIATVNNQFDQVSASQTELIGRLQTQINNEALKLTETP